MKVELPSFNSNVSIKEYLDWVSEVEKFFNYMGTADDKQVCLVAYKVYYQLSNSICRKYNSMATHFYLWLLVVIFGCEREKREHN